MPNDKCKGNDFIELHAQACACGAWENWKVAFDLTNMKIIVQCTACGEDHRGLTFELKEDGMVGCDCCGDHLAIISKSGILSLGEEN